MAYKLWINGAWQDSDGGKIVDLENPATEATIAQVTEATRADVDRAVQAAHAAFYDGRWSRLTPGERSKALWKLADLMEARIEEFSRAETDSTGKPYKFISLGGDLPFAIDNLRFFAPPPRKRASCQSQNHPDETS